MLFIMLKPTADVQFSGVQESDGPDFTFYEDQTAWEASDHGH
jgi:hypothetical protein